MTEANVNTDTPVVTAESDVLVPAGEVRASIQHLFPRVLWWTQYRANARPDLLVDNDFICQKAWTVLANDRRVLVSMWIDQVKADHVEGLPCLLTADHRQANPEDVDGELRRARARRELGDIETRRAIWHAHRVGLSQRAIGDLVGRSQPEVGRAIKKVENANDLVEVTPREIALRRAVGEYSAAEMIARLLTLTYSEGEADPSILGGGYLPGSWDDVRRLRDEELISEDEWRELHRTVIGEEQTPAEIVLPDELE